MYRCKDCGRKIIRTTYKGRPPVRCVPCREKVKEEWRKSHPKN